MDEREGLKSPAIEDRIGAAEALSMMGPDAAFAAVELVGACADEDSVRDYAVAALEELGPPPAESLDDLKALLSADHALVAFWACTLVGRLGSTAKSAQGDLAALVANSKESSVRERAASSLGKIGADSEVAIRALEEAAESTEPRLARVAKASLDQNRT